jgi:hypothetical protein
MDDWMACLFALGQIGTVMADGLALGEAVKIKKAHRDLLPRVGLAFDGRTLAHGGLPAMFAAWHWLATREGADVVRFSRCMFDPAHRTMEDAYAPLFGNPGLFRDFAGRLMARGYVCHQLREPFALDYAMEHARTPTPLGNPLYKDPNHTGVSFDYRPDAAVPQSMVVRIVGYRDLLPRFDQMPGRVKALVWSHTKKCDDCGYCTQTDKTGKRLPLHVPVTYGGEAARLCPLYPGFSFTFERLTPDLCEDVLAFLAFMDG